MGGSEYSRSSSERFYQQRVRHLGIALLLVLAGLLGGVLFWEQNATIQHEQEQPRNYPAPRGLRTEGGEAEGGLLREQQQSSVLDITPAAALERERGLEGHTITKPQQRQQQKKTYPKKSARHKRQAKRPQQFSTQNFASTAAAELPPTNYFSCSIMITITPALLSLVLQFEVLVRSSTVPIVPVPMLCENSSNFPAALVMGYSSTG